MVGRMTGHGARRGEGEELGLALPSDRQSAPCYSRSPFLAFLPRWTATSLKSSPQTRRLRGKSILNFNPSPEATFVPLMQVR